MLKRTDMNTMTSRVGTVQPEINITDVITCLINEIAKSAPIFYHIDINRILVCVASNRRNCRGGTYGKLVPLRFESGLEIIKFSGKRYAMPSIVNNGVQQLYIVYFYIPRFFDLGALEKLRVIFHELYHISPKFNGDIRRFGREKTSHGYSKRRFDTFFEEDLNVFYEYVRNTPFMNFLRANADLLHRNFKRVLGRRMRLPKPVGV